MLGKLEMPISSKNIRNNLELLQRLYDSAMNSSSKDSSLEAALYSKLAIIELSGWIEETIDTILTDYLNRTINNLALRNTIEKEVIQRVYGFRYGTDFRPLMERILGGEKFQYIISRLEKNGACTSQLHHALSILTTRRDRAAHTHQKGVMQSYDAPSWTIQQLNIILPIFRRIQGMVKNMK